MLKCTAVLLLFYSSPVQFCKLSQSHFVFFPVGITKVECALGVVAVECLPVLRYAAAPVLSVLSVFFHCVIILSL